MPGRCREPPDPAGADELRDRHRGVAQDVRGTAVGAHAVGVGVRELEQRREGIELRGDLRILWIARRTHLGSVPAVASVVVPFRAASAKRRLELRRRSAPTSRTRCSAGFSPPPWPSARRSS